MVEHSPKDVLDEDQRDNEGALDEDNERVLFEEDLEDGRDLKDESYIKGDEVVDKHNLQEQEFLKDERDQWLSLAGAASQEDEFSEGDHRGQGIST